MAPLTDLWLLRGPVPVLCRRRRQPTELLRGAALGRGAATRPRIRVPTWWQHMPGIDGLIMLLGLLVVLGLLLLLLLLLGGVVPIRPRGILLGGRGGDLLVLLLGRCRGAE